MNGGIRIKMTTHVKQCTARFQVSFREIIYLTLSSRLVWIIGFVFIFSTFTLSAYAWIAGLLLVISIGIKTWHNYLRFGNITVKTDRHSIYISKDKMRENTYTISKSEISGWISKNQFLTPGVTVHLLFTEKPPILFPISKRQLPTFLHEITPAITQQAKMTPLSSSAMFIHLIKPSYLFILVTFFTFFFWPEYWYLPVLYLVTLIFVRVMKIYKTTYTLSGELVQLQKGVCSTTRWGIKQKSIQQLHIKQSWLEEKLGLATMLFIMNTNHGYPIRLALIPEHTAYTYNKYLEEKAMLKQ